MRGYTFKNYNKEHMARALGISMPISFKQSVEICNFIRNRKVEDAKKILHEVVNKKAAVPFKIYDFDLGHKKKIGPGRYPMKASQEFIKLLENVESNAQFKGLSTSSLLITHINANKAGKSMHYGRKSRRQMKRTDIEVCVEEKSQSKQQKKKETAKTETKEDTTKHIKHGTAKESEKAEPKNTNTQKND